MNKLEKMGAKIISQLTSDSEFGWPPDCWGFIYQPERPFAETSTNSDSDLRNAVSLKEHSR